MKGEGTQHHTMAPLFRFSLIKQVEDPARGRDGDAARTFAGTDQKVPVFGQGTVLKTHDGPGMAMAHQGRLWHLGRLRVPSG